MHVFGSKDVCILKMTIDFNGSMNDAPFLILYMPVSACQYTCVHSCKQSIDVLKVKKKSKGTLF